MTSTPHFYCSRLTLLAAVVTFIQFAAPLGVALPTPPNGKGRVWLNNSAQPTGFVVQLPASNCAPSRSGLNLEIDTRWVSNFGYRPVRVTVTSAKPTTANHLITIRLHLSAADATTVEQDFEMPQGSVETSTTIACPQYHERLLYWWDVWVDGVKDPALSTEASTGVSQFPLNPGQGPGGVLKFLIVGLSSQTGQTTSPGVGTFDTLSLAVADLPSRWLDYTCFDVAALKPSELRTIAQTRPDAFTAICRWVRSGGQLWVSPVGEQWEEASNIEVLLRESNDGGDGLSEPVKIAPAVSDDVVISHGWKPLKVSAAAAQASDAPSATGEEDTVDKKLVVDSVSSYVQRPYGLGYVRLYRKAWDPAGVAWALQMLAAATPANESPPAATPLSVAVATTRSWESRHGLTPDAANGDFANLLVPGVGLAPVTEFRILITLFALAIGPLNYWLLKRWNRPHLMVLTVPVMAVFVTLALFSFAFLSDGFGTTVRVRSYTALDQRNGEAACWSRLSYYSGLAPAQGLALPDDVAVYPIIPGWNETSSQGTSELVRQLEWSVGEARLTQGWLRSRTPTQYMMQRVRKSPARLELTPGAGTLAAKNEFGTAILFVAALDGDGNAFTGEGIAERAKVELAPKPWTDVVAKLRTIVSDNMLTTPPELTDESSSIANTQRRRRRQFFQSQLGLEYSAERLDSNLMSVAISSLGDTNSDAPLDLPPRSYVAITETGPEVVTGIPAAVEDTSFHVVFGKW